MLVNDGSKDNTLDVMRQLQARDPRIKLIDFARNFGHQIAVTAGMDYAGGQAVVIIDSDLQDPPETIVDLINKWKEGFEVVYAVRAKRPGETWFKLATAKLFYRVIYRITDVNIPLDTGDFRLMDRRVVNAMMNMREHNRFIRGMTSWVGFRQAGVLYDRDVRKYGSTNYPLRKMIKLQFFFFFVMGQYIARIYDEVRGRPLYIVADTFGFDAANSDHNTRPARSVLPTVSTASEQ